MGSAHDPELWERLMDKGFHFEVKTDKEGNVDTLATCTANLLLRLDNTLSTWVRQPSPSEKSALKIMALYLDMNVIWDSKSDLLLARIVGTLTHGRLRAHSDSVRQYKNGAWHRLAALPSAMVSEMENALNMCRFLCVDLMSADVARDWTGAFAVLEHKANWAEYTPVEYFDLKKKHWAGTAGEVMGSVPWRLCAAKGNAGLECYASWFQEPMPVDSMKLNFDDCTLSFGCADQEACVKQIDKSPSNNCYQHIGMELSWKPAEHDRARMREFLTTSYAGNPKGRFVIDFAECLGLLNIMVVPKQIFVRGVGGNAKSMVSALRHNVAGGNHSFVSSTVFDKPDEFRIQSGHFAHCRLLTVQECSAGGKLLDSIWKPFVSGEELSSRPNFGRTTEMYSWANAATFWELNVELPYIKVASVEQHGPTPFTRRILDRKSVV